MPTKEEFKKYVQVQKSGLWNMFDPRALKAAGLDKDTYFSVMDNYTKLSEMYPDVYKMLNEDGND